VVTQVFNRLPEGIPYSVERTPLDLVVPFTTPRLTTLALRAAVRLGAGLDSSIRMVRIQVVPFPLDLDHSPVPAEFLERQLAHLCGEVTQGVTGKEDISREVRFAREFEDGLRGALHYRSMILLGTSKRPWKTRNELLARSLREAGYTVVTVPENA
jgi:hypothetical protein